MADNKNNKNKAKSFLQSFADELNGELRDLLELAVRKQFNTQQIIDRFVNTKYFRRQYPGLVTKGGDINAGLSDAVGTGVNAQTLGSAIQKYETGLNNFRDTASQFGYKSFNKHEFARTLNHQTSLQEFTARLQAIDAVDANPAALEAFNQQAKLAGLKPTKDAAYRAAIGAGDRKFQDIFEASQYQVGLGFAAKDARELATSTGGAPVGATPQSIAETIAHVRENLSTIGPELQNQGISPSKLVQILNNPGSFQNEIAKIQQTVASRQSLYGGRGPSGAQAQQGTAGGLSQYGREGQASYG